MKLDRLALERKRTLIRVGRSGAASLNGHLHTMAPSVSQA